MQKLWASTLLFLIFFFLSALSLYINGNKPITGDDIWGATSVLGNPFEVIIFTLRWDVHPPLYYSFLDLWAYFDNSDLWLRLSSAFLHALVTAIAFNYVLHREGLLAASITALLVFTSPLLLEYSTYIRMYSFISLLSIAIFYLTEKLITTNNKRYLVYIFILGFILSNAHAIGILFVFFHFCYGCIKIYPDRPKLIRWIIVNFFLGLLALPAIANGVVKSIGHASQPSFDQVLSLYQSLFISGYSAYILIAILFTILILRDKALRHIVICYLILPIVFFAAISYILKPMWLDRNFIFAIPILSIAAGISLSRVEVPPPLKIFVILFIIFTNIQGSHLFKRYDSSKNTFQQVINTLEKKTAAKDLKTCVISTKPLGHFWSLQRYLNDPQWGNPINIQLPITERWQQIANKLPETAIRLLKLYPHPNFSESKNLIISADSSDRCLEPDIEQLLIVGYDDDEERGKEYKLIFKNSDYTIFEKF